MVSPVMWDYISSSNNVDYIQFLANRQILVEQEAFQPIYIIPLGLFVRMRDLEAMDLLHLSIKLTNDICIEIDYYLFQILV